MVWGFKTRNFPCPIFHDVMITNWYPDVDGQYNIIPWSKDQIVSWHSRDSQWAKFQILNRNLFGRWVLSRLISSDLIKAPGPCQHVILSDCTADVFEIVQVTALTASNLMTPKNLPLNIGIQDTVIQDS